MLSVSNVSKAVSNLGIPAEDVRLDDEGWKVELVWGEDKQLFCKI